MKNSVFLFNGMRILQDDKCHSLGLDTVLLSDFATVKKNMRVLDLGAGNGALSFLLAGREKTAEFDGIEISDAACALADENISLNGMRDNIKIHRADFCSKDLPLEPNSFDLAVSNPPYFAYGSGKKAEGARGLARSESACSLPGLLKTAARFLKWGGYFAVVYRPERLSELIF
ncbi:MAG: methyltransferase, partial [Bacillota bacterium]|nr:methyltransferase [Bacillota bacterium]